MHTTTHRTWGKLSLAHLQDGTSSLWEVDCEDCGPLAILPTEQEALEVLSGHSTHS